MPEGLTDGQNFLQNQQTFGLPLETAQVFDCPEPIIADLAQPIYASSDTPEALIHDDSPQDRPERPGFTRRAAILAAFAIALVGSLGVFPSNAMAKDSKPKPDVSTSGITCEFFYAPQKGFMNWLTKGPNVLRVYNSSLEKREVRTFYAIDSDTMFDTKDRFLVKDPKEGFTFRRRERTYNDSSGIFKRVQVSVKGFDGKEDCDRISAP